MPTKLRLAIGSIVVGFVVLLIKAAAYWVTGSVALLSDALESTVNVATAIAALVAIRVASRPADAMHPYGHDKAEFFGAVLEGVMIIVAALLILREAWEGLLAPRAIDLPALGLAITLGATAINGVWAFVLVRKGRSEESPALVADGRHLWTDVVTSLGVVAGVALAVWTGIRVLDPILAALVALNILWSGWKVVRESLSGLMDEAVPEERLSLIRDVIAENAEGAYEAHDLRTRHAGTTTFIDFHLIVPGEMSVHDAHEICDRIENRLEASLTDARVTIHMEPEHKSKQRGIIVLS
jgi:cation diffusion facilitator family transporter